jgi:hypothetical protein
LNALMEPARVKLRMKRYKLSLEYNTSLHSFKEL